MSSRSRREERTPNACNQSETLYNGIGASKGIAIGECYAFIKEENTHEPRELNEKNCKEEVERFLTALSRSEHELKKIEQVTIRKLGKSYSNLFQAQIMMLHDPVLVETISKRIVSERKGAHLVIDDEFNKYLQHFKNSDHTLFQERADDLLDIKNRIIRNLDIRKLHSWIPEGVIVCCDTLSPADIILLSRSNIKGFVTATGGKTSHISLICKSLKIPMVVGLGQIADKVATGMAVIIDGANGTVITNPSAATLEEYFLKQKNEQQSSSNLQAAMLPATTQCGVRVSFYANIDFREEAFSLAVAGAEGVGLFRSENLFTEGTKTPKEEEQFACYHAIADAIAPMRLDVRLFDIGGDKLLYSPVKEINPNLGWRGIRILLDLPEILDTQIRAILQANTHGNIDILIPMVMSLHEIHTVRESVERQFAELQAERDGQITQPGIGAMIELPAAVELIEEITQCVDFISIGTNDLTQYTLAVDRNNVIVQDLFDRFHPAVMRQVHRIIQVANKNHCCAMMCGDMASDSLALPFLLGCGLRNFSVVVSEIAELKAHVARYALAETEALAQECLALNNPAAIKARLEAFQAAITTH